MVNQYGNRWRFKFNAKKSAILTYGEEPKKNLENSSLRSFKLGNNRVLEKQSYDHVGVKACLYKDDNPRVDEKIVKARRAFNACAGLGIRKNGLTMLTCNIIYWVIVVPIVTFGAEIWCLSESDHEKLNKFQIHVGKRIQRFPSRSPNSCSFFGLGWMRLSTYILVKKMLFALTILRMDVDSIIRQVFTMRICDFKLKPDVISENVHNSPTCEILKAADRLGILKILCDMSTGGKPLYSKKGWSRYVWERAWMLEDLYWKSASFLKKDNDLLMKVMDNSRYLSWWELSDRFPPSMRMCETMAKLLSHASRLKCDDIRLKGLTHSHKACSDCDLFQVEDLFHVIMQCPGKDKLRRDMYLELTQVNDQLEEIFADKPQDVFGWLIGKPIESLDRYDMHNVWLISGKYICEMYKQICMKKDKVGVG